MKVLKFSASWCAPCKSMQKQIDKLKDGGKLNIEIVHIDIDEEPITTKEYGIRSVPTLIKLDEKVELVRSVGSLTTEKLLNFLS